MTSRCKAAIFDMDGTLLESMRFWRFAALEFLMDQNLPISEEVLSGVFGRSARKTVQLAYEQAGIDASEIPSDFGLRMLRYVIPHYERHVTVKENALEYVKKLHESGVHCCIATATNKYYAAKVLKKFGFDKYIEFIFDESDGGTNKAHAEYFERLSERLGLPLNECELYEDALYSIKTAKQVGMRVVAIEDFCNATTRDDIRSIADQYITSFSELL